MIKYSLKAMFFLAIEYFTYPLLLFISTPFILHSIGTHNFALWTLTLSLLAMWGMFNLGITQNTMRLVAKYNNGSKEKLIFAVRQHLTSSFLVSFFFLTLMFIFSSFIASHYFVAMGSISETSLALKIGSVLLFMAQIEFFFKSTLKGLEKFHYVAFIEFIIKILFIATIFLVVAKSDALKYIYLTTFSYALFSLLLNGFFVAKIVGISCFRPYCKIFSNEDLHFSGWSWIQLIGGTLFQHADKLLIAIFLGSTSLTSYALCLQLAQQIHAIPAAIFSFLLPYFSKNLRKKYHHSFFSLKLHLFFLNFLISLLLVIPILIFAKPILALWIGVDFALKNSDLLIILSLSFFLLSISVSSHYFLISSGYIQRVSLLNLLGGFISIMISFFVLDKFGIIGMAWAKSIFGIILIAGFIYLQRTNPHNKRHIEVIK